MEKLQEDYRVLAAQYDEAVSKEKRILFVISISRLLVFFGGIFITAAGFLRGAFPGIVALLASVSAFLILLILFSRHTSKLNFFRNLAGINRAEIKGLAGDLSEFESGEKWIEADHDFSHDIDLFGEDSLFHYLNRTVTGYGTAVLAGWLSNPETLSADLDKRQETIRELASKLRWRQEFLALGTGRILDEEDVKSLLAWMEERSSFSSSGFGNIIRILFPVMALSTLILAIAGSLHYSFFIMVFLINLFITAILLRKTNRIHAIVSKKYMFLASLGQLMKTFREEPFHSEIMAEIKNCLTQDYSSAVANIRKLSRIIQSFDSRLNLMMGFILNGLLLWDQQCMRSLEKWKKESSGLLPTWLKKTGEVDAFISLANFAYNHPGYTYPVKSDNGEVITATELGHPLIMDISRVCNDFEIPARGRIGIITGANMAGKSTFLRTVAVNFVLGMAGAPVCAKKMNFIPLRLFTSMRTTDSLSHNESYFYAELKRLKSLKERIEANEDILFILDEILKGTNSTDKSAGSKLFIKKIMEYGSTGLIATHDISLGEMEIEYPGVIFNKCFEIEIDGENISFDYLLRNGITSKMNAALLMKQMGIAE